MTHDAAHTYEITLSDVSVTFGNNTILDSFSLSILKGEKVTLTGPSGAGKSTVLRCILGFVLPHTGTIRVKDIPLDSTHIWRIRQHIAYVPQEPVMLPGTVSDILHRPFSYASNAAYKDNLGRIPEYMSRFNLPENLLQEKIDTLSGGEKQRIALVAALLLGRQIILLDEASSALDSENARAVADFFAHADDMTVLSVSHKTEWESFSNRTISLRNGRDVL